MEAASNARAEADKWSFALSLVDLLASGWNGPEPTEVAVTGHDPGEELARIAGRWGHELPDHRLQSLLAFGAALANAEAEAWDADDPVTATKALEARRFLLGDRVIHWAVPWLITVGATESNWAPEAMAAAQALLDLADQHRPAPLLTGEEGLAPPGHDSLGELPAGLDITHVGGGWLFQDHTTQVGPEPYEAAAVLWDDLAERHPGSARLWRDLAERARRSAAHLARRSAED